jgi:hypothetical protein
MKLRATITYDPNLNPYFIEQHGLAEALDTVKGEWLNQRVPDLMGEDASITFETVEDAPTRPTDGH